MCEIPFHRQRRPSIHWDFKNAVCGDITSKGFTESVYQLPKRVKETRNLIFWSRELQDFQPGHLNYFDLCDQDTKEVRYSMSCYDRAFPSSENPAQRLKMVRGLKPTIAILVPIADQHHWLYRSKQGHQRLAERAGARRIICCFLPDFGVLSGSNIHPVETVEKIKKEIGPHLIELCVDRSQPVLLMTQQEKFEDERKEVYRAKSDFAGQILVFDAVVDQEDDELKNFPEEVTPQTDLQIPGGQVTSVARPSKYHRRAMLFECNPRMAQTEVWLCKTRDEVVFEYHHVCHAYQLLLLRSLGLLPELRETNARLQGVILGLGGGMLTMLLQSLFGNRLQIDAVDIDPVVADIARTCFGFKESENIRLHIKDGYDYLTEKAKTVRQALNFVIIDINCADGSIGGEFESVSCPPAKFLNFDLLNTVKSMLMPSGLLLVNCVSHTQKGQSAVASALKKAFRGVCSSRFNEDLNEIFVCTPEADDMRFEGFDEVRAGLTKMVAFLPGLQRVIDKTPMYLSKKAYFATQFSNW